MRSPIILALLFALAFGAQASANPKTEQAADASHADAKPQVFDAILRDGAAGDEATTAELQSALKTGNAIVLDARAYEEYAVSHIPGAKAVPSKPGLTPALYTADVNAVLSATPDKTQPFILYCNGLNCGRSRRFADEMIKAGYRNVRRYQLGAPGWRALGGLMQVEKSALLSLLEQDKTAWLVDARESAGSMPALRNAKTIPLRDASKAKDDGRLPMTDHNTRIFVVGESGTQARAVGEALAHDAFDNVAFYDGSIAELKELHAAHQ